MNDTDVDITVCLDCRLQQAKVKLREEKEQASKKKSLKGKHDRHSDDEDDDVGQHLGADMGEYVTEERVPAGGDDDDDDEVDSADVSATPSMLGISPLVRHPSALAMTVAVCDHFFRRYQTTRSSPVRSRRAWRRCVHLRA